ncbi:MAG: hypothetical protein KME42_19700 [Tildeniella nuda ZEHNDER 1965/U140]|jgi:hypothetical protein|nr:hypothetical protein [Tildeniella nuda ZEHNDER 1965/U140]
MPLANAVPPEAVGIVLLYTGTNGAAQGYLNKYNGKWLYLTLDAFRTVGNANSGAAIAFSWTEPLFTHLWSQYTQTRCPVLTSVGGASTRGVSAAADYAANKRITLPDERGRVFAGAGTGSSLTARTQHEQKGEELHVQTIAEMPTHSHNDRLLVSFTGGATGYAGQSGSLANALPIFNTGTGNGFNVVQPTTFEHVLIAAGTY